MFIGHFAVGLAAKKVSPKTPLPLLIAGAQLVDLLWPFFILIGLESVKIVPGITTVTPLDFVSYPYTHSLLASLLWGAAFGGVVFAFRKNGREFWVLGGLVVSHWVLDLMTHRPDLPLVPWSATRVGFELWSSLPATLILEVGLFLGGILVYRSAVMEQGKKLSVPFWLLIGFLFVMYFANLFGPPPPSVDMIATAGNAMWLFVLWAWWSERRLLPIHRTTET